MTESMIYWITRLNGIHGLCTGIQCLAVFLAIGGTILAAVAACVKVTSESDESADDARIAGGICKMGCKVLIPAVCVAMICALTRTFTPTTKEMIAIKVIPQIASVDNVEKIKDISKDMLDITVDWLKDMRKTYVDGQDK